MLKHIVFLKMKNDTTQEDKTGLAEDLRALKGKTNGLMVECEVGLDIMHTDNSYHIALNSTFHNTGELEKYRVHPEHVTVLEKIKRLCSDIVKVDYEV